PLPSSRSSSWLLLSLSSWLLSLVPSHLVSIRVFDVEPAERWLSARFRFKACPQLSLTSKVVRGVRASPPSRSYAVPPRPVILIPETPGMVGSRDGTVARCFKVPDTGRHPLRGARPRRVGAAPKEPEQTGACGRSALVQRKVSGSR